MLNRRELGIQKRKDSKEEKKSDFRYIGGNWEYRKGRTVEKREIFLDIYGSREYRITEGIQKKRNYVTKSS